MVTWGYVLLTVILLVMGFLGYCVVAVGTRMTAEEQQKDDANQIQYIQEKMGHNQNSNRV